MSELIWEDTRKITEGEKVFILTLPKRVLKEKFGIEGTAIALVKIKKKGKKMIIEIEPLRKIEKVKA